MRPLMLLTAAAVTLGLAVPASAGPSTQVGVVHNFGPPLAATCHNPEGIAIDPTGNLYAASFAFQPVANICVVNHDGALGNGRLLLINPGSHAVRVVATGFQAPNGLTQDRHRNIYISDSFRGVIFKVAPDGTPSVWKQDVRLTPQPGTGPPFGANGVAFDRNQRFLYVATTADAKIYRIPVL